MEKGFGLTKRLVKGQPNKDVRIDGRVGRPWQRKKRNSSQTHFSMPSPSRRIKTQKGRNQTETSESRISILAGKRKNEEENKSVIKEVKKMMNLEELRE